MNEVYGEYFGDEPPARACVEVSRLFRDLKVEIESIAYIHKSSVTFARAYIFLCIHQNL